MHLKCCEGKSANFFLEGKLHRVVVLHASTSVLSVVEHCMFAGTVVFLRVSSMMRNGNGEHVSVPHFVAPTLRPAGLL